METLRYLDKSINQNERNLFSGWWREQINVYGQEINYFSNKSTLSGMNVLYGEEPNAGYLQGQKLIVLLNLNNDSYLLSKFGIIADNDLNGVLHPDDFTNVFGLSSEPKPSDLLQLSEFGSDRLNWPKRGATVYELTEVIDEFVTNPLGGHYVWFFKAKRYDYSYEDSGDGSGPGSGEGNKPINDNDVLEALADSNFNYPEENPCSNTSVYGEY
jgi:hypothetical protein